MATFGGRRHAAALVRLFLSGDGSRDVDLAVGTVVDGGLIGL